MSNLSQEHRAVLDKQIADWTKELRHLVLEPLSDAQRSTQYALDTALGRN